MISFFILFIAFKPYEQSPLKHNFYKLSTTKCIHFI